MSNEYNVRGNTGNRGRPRATASVCDRDTLSGQARARSIQERRGSGERATYVPGRSFRELRGIGRMHRFSCERCGGRQIALSSDLHLATFLEEHRDQRTWDLREYFPLNDVEETVRIARAIGVRHPAYSDGSPRILITDLLVFRLESARDSWTAIHTVSARDEAAGMGAAWQIVREFWRRTGVDARIAYSDGLNSFRTRNLWFLFGYSERLAAYGVDDGQRSAQQAVIRHLCRRDCVRILDVCDAAAATCDLTRAECMCAVLQLVASRAIECDLDVPFLLDQPARSFRTADNARQIMDSFARRDSGFPPTHERQHRRIPQPDE